MSEFHLIKKNITGSITSEIFIGNIKDQEEMNKDIIKTIDQEVGWHDYKTNVKAQMTDWRLHKYPGFDKFCVIISKVAKAISKNTSYSKFQIDNVWGCKYKSNEETLVHDHWPNIWSLAYYISPPENCSELVFPEFNYEIKPEHGMLVIFPGHYLHQVNKKPFKGYRYVVSANIR